MHIWQKQFINNTFEMAKKSGINYIDALSNDLKLLNSKNQHIPNSLYKFYTATIDNIFDMKNQVLWMSSPKYFNDPFDCYLSYNSDEYEKKYLLNIIKKQNLIDGLDTKNSFTEEEYYKLLNSYTRDRYNIFEEWHHVLNQILNSKSDEFNKQIQKLLWDCMDEGRNKFNYFKINKIRVSCFSASNKYNCLYKNILMWSHYADNHKGFCVEYDMKMFQEDIVANMPWIDFYNKKDIYLNEKMRLTIKAGLFPVMYGNQLVKLPIRDFYKAKFVNNEIKNFYNIDKAVFRSYLTKSSNWSYEKEWRIIIDDEICKYYDYKIPFPYIKSIFLGCNMDNRMIKLLSNIANDLNIPIKVIKLNDQKYELWDWDIDTAFYSFNEEKKKYVNPFQSQ